MQSWGVGVHHRATSSVAVRGTNFDNVKFVLYRAGAAHPTLGDEARQGLSSNRYQNVEYAPARAIVALRHPMVSGRALDEVWEAYAPKLRVGRRALLVDESKPWFDHVKILDDLGTNMQVMMTKVSAGWTGDPLLKVPSLRVFGGWPARDAELTYPVRLLVEDVKFMWPHAVHDEVVVKREGECVDPETGLGSLLRSPHDLSISIDGIDYPLIHDVKASKAGASASKAAGRRHLVEVLRSEIRLILTVSLMIALLEYDLRRRRLRIAESQLSSHETYPTSQTQQKGLVSIKDEDLVWALPDLPVDLPSFGLAQLEKCDHENDDATLEESENAEALAGSETL